MRTRNRVVAFLLTFCMLFSNILGGMPPLILSVSAEEYEIEETEFAEEPVDLEPIIEVGEEEPRATVVKAPYYALGQDAYFTGANYVPTGITPDGSINADEGWVDVTPKGVDATVANRVLGKVASNTAIAEKAVSDVHEFIFEQKNEKYYVAQDEDYVYFALVQSLPMLFIRDL